MDISRPGRRADAPIGKALIDSFRDGFRGQILIPGNAGYDDARRIWNADVDSHPGLVARCSGVADIVHAVTFARAADLPLAVRSGGHKIVEKDGGAGGIVIDLSAMKGVFVDPRSRTVRVQAGATLGDLDRETRLHGLEVPVGVISRSGVDDYALGGGVGWLVRKYGLTCDSVLSCEVVTADGEVVTASDDAHADIFWGVRVGGRFGVVTSFVFRAQPSSAVWGRQISHPASRAGDDRKEPEVMASAPEGLPAIALFACYCGEIGEGDHVLAPAHMYATPIPAAAPQGGRPIGWPRGVSAAFKARLQWLSDEFDRRRQPARHRSRIRKQLRAARELRTRYDRSNVFAFDPKTAPPR